MKYSFRRNGRCWHIVLSAHPARTTGLVTFCYEKIFVPDYMVGTKFKDGLFRSNNVVEAIQKVPPVNPRTLERLSPPDAEEDLTGRICRECQRRFQRSTYSKDDWSYSIGEMKSILMAEIK